MYLIASGYFYTILSPKTSVSNIPKIFFYIFLSRNFYFLYFQDIFLLFFSRDMYLLYLKDIFLHSYLHKHVFFSIILFTKTIYFLDLKIIYILSPEKFYFLSLKNIFINFISKEFFICYIFKVFFLHFFSFHLLFLIS